MEEVADGRVEGMTSGTTLRVFYDGDCGVCGACAAWAIRHDHANVLRFIGQPAGEEIPPGFEREAFEALCLTTVVAWEPASGRTYVRHQGIARVLDALPHGWLLSWPLKLPVISSVFGVLYDAFASRRHRVSALLGMGVCSLPEHGSPLPTPRQGDADG